MAVQFQESSRSLSGASASTSYSRRDCADSSPDWQTRSLTVDSFRLLHQHPRAFRLTQHTLTSRRCGGPGRVQPAATAPFASLTSLIGDGLRLFGLPASPKDDPLRQTFNSIDARQKGHIDEEDLIAYAQLQGLPGAYVKPFVAAVRSARSASGGSSSGEEEEEGPELTYVRFKRFVEGREEGLRHAFGLFDKDKDGRISFEDLDASLAHVAVCCPNTRCVYRTRECMVRELLQRLGSDYSNRSITFNQFRQFFVLLPQTDMVVEYWLSATAAGSCCDVGGRVLVQEKRRRGSPWGHLFAGAVAGAASRTATAPLETMRLIAMAGAPAAGVAAAQQVHTPSLLQTAQQVMQTHGWKALYRGNAINVMRCAPSKALDFFAFDMQEGPRGLFRGLGPSLAAIAPEAAITYGLHDLLKRSYKRWHHQEPGVGPSLAFGVLSAFSGQLIAYPLETVSRRLQVAAVNSGPRTMQGVVQALLREGGPAAFYRGVGAATIRLIPMAIVSFGSYEAVRAALLHWELKRDLAEVQARYRQLNRMLQGATALLQQQQAASAQGGSSTSSSGSSNSKDPWNGHRGALQVEEEASGQRGAAAAVGAAAAALEAAAPEVPRGAVAKAQQTADRAVVTAGALQAVGGAGAYKDEGCPAVACVHAPDAKQR